VTLSTVISLADRDGIILLGNKYLKAKGAAAAPG